MKYVFINEGRAQEIIPEFVDIFPGIPVQERYAPDFLAKCVQVEDHVQVEEHWLYDEATHTFKDPTE